MSKNVYQSISSFFSVLHFVNKRMGLVQAEDDITVQTLEENGNPSPTDSSHKTRTKF